MAAVFKQRYVKQTLIIIVGVLFLLSSFEWTSQQVATISDIGTDRAQLPAPVVKKITKSENEQSICCSKHTHLTEEHPAFQSNLHASIITSTSRLNKYLIIHSLRI
ncbi:hypothetical protein QWZ08_00655 [Ferruginibacter paludis]|uniref:hypothetical protein n=1 Tax=Ferruginibacter paludis TaxID=1310417 RepID=UPI0025B2F157|nr:hypothetical protein [Ferruginibacter paludis]MDN3654112.1 hypothetical protein [Ferruginibacter paludis]